MLNWNELLTQAINNPGSTSNTYNRFYNYSFVNRMHLMFQGVKEPVATYKKWLELGRQVKKGEKAKYIVRPLFCKDKVDPNKTILRGFKPVNCIFSLSQTDGEELSIETDKWDKTKALETLGIKEIPFELIDGNTQGYACKDGIAINPVAKYPLKTLIHEIAHKVMNHLESEESKEIKEFQAETVAYILMHEIEGEFNASESRNYIQTWLKDNVPTEAEIKRVFKSIDTILNAGLKEKVADPA